jgi:transcriptional regulator with XRE-family HTH domain
VAEHLGLNVALIRSYEAAFVIPYPKTLERLADLLDTPVLPLIELRNTAVSIQRAQAEERRGSART